MSTVTIIRDSDREILTALNRDYVASVQNGDVRRFEEILAEDFSAPTPTARSSTSRSSSRRRRGQ